MSVVSIEAVPLEYNTFVRAEVWKSGRISPAEASYVMNVEPRPISNLNL